MQTPEHATISPVTRAADSRAISGLPRPLRLRAAYVWRMRARAATAIVIAAVALLAGAAWPGRDLVRAWDLERTWERSEPLELVRLDVRHAHLLGVLHVVRTAVVYRDETGERVARGDRFRTPFTPALSVAHEARRDPVTDRVLTSIGVASRAQRVAAAALALVMVIGCALVLLSSARRRLIDLRVAARAAARSHEVVLELAAPPRWRRYRFRAAAPEAPQGGYRDSARARVEVVARVRSDEPPPLLIAEEYALGLRTDGGDILVVREGLWPLELSAEETADVRARLATWNP